MSHLATLFKNLARDESGAALVEYAVIFAVVLAGTIAAFDTLSTALLAVFTAVETALGAVL